MDITLCLQRLQVGSLGHDILKALRDVKIVEELYISRLITESTSKKKRLSGLSQHRLKRRLASPCARRGKATAICQVGPSLSAIAAKCLPFIALCVHAEW